MVGLKDRTNEKVGSALYCFLLSFTRCIAAGLFIIGVRYMYFVDDYELSASTGDIVEVERMKTNAFGEPLPESLTEQIKHTVHKWSFDDCKDVLNR